MTNLPFIDATLAAAGIRHRPTPDRKKSGRRGYDTLALHPLYGDGKYSVGHVRLL